MIKLKKPLSDIRLLFKVEQLLRENMDESLNSLQCIIEHERPAVIFIMHRPASRRLSDLACVTVNAVLCCTFVLFCRWPILESPLTATDPSRVLFVPPPLLLSANKTLFILRSPLIAQVSQHSKFMLLFLTDRAMSSLSGTEYVLVGKSCENACMYKNWPAESFHHVLLILECLH